MCDWRSGYSQQEPDDFKIIYFDNNLYLPLYLHRRMIY